MALLGRRGWSLLAVVPYVGLLLSLGWRLSHTPSGPPETATDRSETALVQPAEPEG